MTLLRNQILKSEIYNHTRGCFLSSLGFSHCTQQKRTASEFQHCILESRVKSSGFFPRSKKQPTRGRSYLGMTHENREYTKRTHSTFTCVRKCDCSATKRDLHAYKARELVIYTSPFFPQYDTVHYKVRLGLETEL